MWLMIKTQDFALRYWESTSTGSDEGETDWILQGSVAQRAELVKEVLSSTEKQYTHEKYYGRHFQLSPFSHSKRTPDFKLGS